MSLARRRVVTAVAATMLAGSLVGAPAAWSAPAGFPDVDSSPSVDPARYYVQGSHPSNSGWTSALLPG